MQTTLLRGSDTVIGEITTQVAAQDPDFVSIRRLDKHTYVCRVGENRFVFRTVTRDPKTAPRGPGIELRQTLTGSAPKPLDLEEIPGRPGIIGCVHFEGPLHLHIERMDDRRYWCRIGDHEFSVTAPGRSSASIELVSAGPSSSATTAP